MDELTLLRRLDADTPAPSKAALSDAFDALTDRMTATEQRGRTHVPPRRRRGIRLRRAALITAGAAALVVALVLTDTIGVAGLRPGATAEAAAVLDHAAEATIRTIDPVVRPGQYLRISTTYRSSSEGGTQERPLTWIRQGTDTTWIPYDRADQWTMVRTPERPVAWFSPAAKAEALRSYRRVLKDYDGREELLRAREGNFFGSPADDVGFADLPRDPRVLLNRIYRTTIGQGQSPDGEAMDWIAGRLRTGVVPADLRAALYRAAAMIPGVAVVDRRAVLDGRTGIALGRTEPLTGLRQELVVDPATGLLIGEREVFTRAANGIPAGVVVGSTAVTTTVVDSAPSGPEHRVQ